jgi:biotin carboxyl carrier protein
MVPNLYDPPPPLDPSDAMVVRLALLNPENGMPEIKIIAEVAGRICAVAAEVGSTINEGDDVVFVEAMKMEIPVAASASGKLKAILVKIDDVVAEGQAVAILES